MELSRPLTLLSTLWPELPAVNGQGFPEAEIPTNPHIAHKGGSKHRYSQDQGHAGHKLSSWESRTVQTRHTELLVSTQGPIPPSHSPFPHQLQHKELM